MFVCNVAVCDGASTPIYTNLVVETFDHSPVEREQQTGSIPFTCGTWLWEWWGAQRLDSGLECVSLRLAMI